MNFWIFKREIVPSLCHTVGMSSNTELKVTTSIVFSKLIVDFWILPLGRTYMKDIKKVDG